MSTPIVRPPTKPADSSVRQPRLQFNRSSQFINHHSNSTVFQHFPMTPEDSSVLEQHCYPLTATIHAHDSNLFWHMVCYKCRLLTYLLCFPLQDLITIHNNVTCRCGHAASSVGSSSSGSNSIPLGFDDGGRLRNRFTENCTACKTHHRQSSSIDFYHHMQH